MRGMKEKESKKEKEAREAHSYSHETFALYSVADR